MLFVLVVLIMLLILVVVVETLVDDDMAMLFCVLMVVVVVLLPMVNLRGVCPFPIIQKEEGVDVGVRGVFGSSKPNPDKRLREATIALSSIVVCDDQL